MSTNTGPSHSYVPRPNLKLYEAILLQRIIKVLEETESLSPTLPVVSRPMMWPQA